MSSDSSTKELTNEEIRRRLTTEFQMQCGPVTPSTRKVLLKKLNELEREKSLLSQQECIVEDVPESDLDSFENGSDQDLSGSYLNGNGHAENGDNSRVSNVEISSQRSKRSPRSLVTQKQIEDKLDAMKAFNVSIFQVIFLFFILYSF